MSLSRRSAVLFAAAAPLAACVSVPKLGRARDRWSDGERAVRANLATQQSAWNSGSLDGFMAFYWRDPRLVFVSGASWTVGWDAVMERYRRNYPNSNAMGQLEFSDLQVSMIAEDAAQAWGRWTVTRAQAPLTGMFTLLWRRMETRDQGENWFIVYDHTSS